MITYICFIAAFAFLRLGTFCQETRRFRSDVNNLAISAKEIFVATDNYLFKLNRSLNVEVEEALVLNKSQSNRVKILLVLEDNSTLVLCGTGDTGACEMRDLHNVSHITVKTKSIVSTQLNGSVVGFIYDSHGKKYLAVGSFDASLQISAEIITLRSLEGTVVKFTAQEDLGGLTPSIKRENIAGLRLLEFVDGFQIKNISYFVINMHVDSSYSNVTLFRMETNKDDKNQILCSLKYALVSCCTDKPITKLLASTLLLHSVDSALWVGVFSAERTGDFDSTALGLFDLENMTEKCSETEVLSTRPSKDCFYLKPIKMLLVHLNLTAVLAIEINQRIVLFLGTRDGMMLKVVMDQKLNFIWKTVLHEFTEEKAVFNKMILEPHSEQYIYAAAANQIAKIKVANCEGGTLKECWEHQDPFCGWCTPQNRCSFKSECQNLMWVPMVEGPMQDTRQLISVKMLQNKTGVVAKITMHVNRNLTKNYYCQLSGKENSLCESSFPQCTCKIENNTLLSQGLQVTVNITQSLHFSEILNLHDCRNVVKETSKTPCLDCIKAGCSWSGSTCSFATSEMEEEKCPALLELNMTSPNEIAIRLAHPDKIKTKNLTCVFNGKQTKGGVLNNDTLMCELVNMSTSGALTSVNVLTESSMIDNPQSLSVPSCFFTGQCKESGLDAKITILIPNETSIAGKRQVIIKGSNFWGGNTTKVQLTQFLTVTELQVESSTETEIKFSLPKASKGKAELCVKLPDGRCHGSIWVTYRHKPSCGNIFPSTTWDSGGRYLNINGTSMNLVEEVIFENYTITSELSGSIVRFKTPKLTSQPSRLHSVKLVVVGEELMCEMNIMSYPDAEFQGFTTTAVGNQWQITIKKRSDQLGITKDEVIVDAIVNNKIYPCPVLEDIVNDTIICKTDASFGLSGLKVQIRIGNFSTVLEQPFNWLWLLLIIPFIFIFLIIGACCITRRKEKELSRKLSQQLELLENDIRNEIREGFAELQTEKSDLIEGSVVLPFLDYKHFANRIFFPEVGSNSRCFVNDICTPFQDTQELNTDGFSKALFDLLSNKLFLISLVHTLEAQKTFTIKDRCTFASCLTIALHSNLDYLTDVMKDLLQDLMDQSTNTQPKLMLRRTESVVEKLLTNWMSICLYGFLRESVGEPLFLLVSALSQRISKGPVDAITEKALYTLNEDWLLWQAQDFNNLKLNVTFPASPGTDDITLDVNVLDCDTVEQGKEKILQIFKMKFGYFQQFQAKHIDIEYDNNGIYLRLQEIDQSSKALDNGTTVLNTFMHYKIPDGAKIRVTRRTNQPKISTQESIKDDNNYDKKYCHLIKADLEELEDQVNSAQKRKKVKLKEVYLTKLLSTKVAVHSFVENLFRTIWGTPNNKVPIAIKYFFDFLDHQGENKKITDPDVLHIWKTNSLPLRYWVNILKNPQFVFDMEKSAHLDGCLSVIAQAFMDCFSLTDQQLGKHAPTNKLLYAKDIPQFKEEVKAYYKQIRESPPLSDEDIKNFLMEESKKHENEFNVQAALGEIYKYISTHFTELLESMEQEETLQNVKGELLHVKDLFEEKKMIRWQ